jgi:preprotein translocase SecE subunit
MKINLSLKNIVRNITRIPGKIGSLFAGVLVELRQVEWLKFDQVVKSTLVIIVLSVLITLLVGSLDQILVLIRGILFNRTLI